MILAVTLTGRDYLPLISGYYCYFAAGVVLAIFKTRVTPFSIASLLVCLGLCVAFSLKEAVAMSAAHQRHFSELIIGAAIACFFLFFLYVNTQRGASLKLRGSKLLGALTYPIYLIHAHIGYMIISAYATEANKLAVLALTLLLVLLMAYFIHVLIERHYATFWKSLFQVAIGNLIEWGSRKCDGFRFWFKSLVIRA